MLFDGLKLARRGAPITAEQWNNVIQAIHRYRVVAGEGVTMRQTPNGTVFSVRSTQQRQEVKDTSVFPFKLQWNKTEDSYVQQIYLPQGSLYVNGKNISISGAFTTGDSNWKTFSNYNENVYLHVAWADEVTLESGEVLPEESKAKITNSSELPVFDFDVEETWSFTVGAFDMDAYLNGNYKIKNQLLTSSIILSTSGDGTTFTPHIDSDGNLSWTNDGGKENPPTVNIKGEKGDKGDKGDDGVVDYSKVEGYANAAAGSASAAAGSASAAAGSAAGAAGSAAGAAGSASAAKNSENNAAASANSAASNASKAAESASKAEKSASDAKSSAQTASTSANAANSAAAAANAAANAANSAADAAANSANNAKSSADSASESADSAADSATEAQDSATKSKNSADSASSAASNAASSAQAASSSSSSASSEANAARVSADNAAGSASNAASSAQAAQQSAQAAMEEAQRIENRFNDISSGIESAQKAAQDAESAADRAEKAAEEIENAIEEGVKLSERDKWGNPTFGVGGNSKYGEL